MRIVVQDFCGHPFQVQLSRELASRGHTVMHWYCTSYPSGKGRLAPQPDDSVNLSILGLAMGSAFQRYSPLTRLRQEAAYGRLLSERLRRAKPDVFLACNTPLISLFVAARTCVAQGTPMIFWQQDVISAAIDEAARKRLGAVGSAIGVVAERMERSIARSARAVIPISSSFLPVLHSWGVRSTIRVIPNWAPIAELPIRTRDNPWSREHDLTDKPVVLYSGTLGVKHDPGIFVDLARRLKATLGHGTVVVISEGRGRDWLAGKKALGGLENLLLLDYQPYERLPDVMAAADVLVAVLEPAASQYSVPSKVLSYLCSGRPIVGVMPRDNAAATTILSSRSGVVVDPGAPADAIETILHLLSDDAERGRLGSAGRAYAERTFDLREITDQFEALLNAGSGNAESADEQQGGDLHGATTPLLELSDLD